MAAGYDGPLYLEIAPQTFSVLVRMGTRLNQLRLKRGAPPTLETRSVGVDLSGGVGGYRARRHAGVIDMDKEAGHDPRDFWEALEPRRGELLLDPGEFYILASKDLIEIPADQAAEMTPIDPAVGEFRVHYAGFFDPGFGTAEAGGEGSRGVLEVRSRETPFLLEDGQTVARLVYEPLTERPSRLYGVGRITLPAAGSAAEQALPRRGTRLRPPSCRSTSSAARSTRRSIGSNASSGMLS